MKHGFMVLGEDDIFGKVSYGSFPTLHEAKIQYHFLKRAGQLTEVERSRIRLVELVEREISVDK